MFFVINKIEHAVHSNDGLHNPKNPSNPMVLGIYRTQSKTALFTVYSKKAYGEFWDEVTQKKIPRRFWIPEMKAFASQKAAEAPQPPFIFKLTVVGWIFVALMIATMGLIVYQEVKPPVPKSAIYTAMEKAPVVGDIFFGHYEKYKEKRTPIGAEIGFGWFKIVKVEGSDFYLSKSMEMSKTSKPKEQLNSSDYETETLPALQLSEQTGYNIRFKSADGLTEVYISEKK
ncbi:hypothetical protein [Sphingobacterium hungaricum]|uniref:Uncharacterized protein n=1 Tax=Sphingobacterium hungaricum TaxID=2082723 RepID=A0A928YS34_9SPHI|nr:hypothetical protein [Sphingobacterium hungaricum]MBE8715317.1 hypothetical protein [Sphingobacterium hungaricum]